MGFYVHAPCVLCRQKKVFRERCVVLSSGLKPSGVKPLRTKTRKAPKAGNFGWIGANASAWQFVLGIGMACAVTALPILILFMEKLQILREALGQRILRYASRLGHDNAKRLFLTAARLEAEELLRIGFLTTLTTPDALDTEVDALAATLAANAPLAVQGVKLALNELARGEWSDAAFSERAEAALKSQDLKEGLAAVQAKRSAKFEGR